ncbi:MAG: ubiquinol-cytochrome C chaperone [Alphaproteobacteria bacterium]|nr:ubiquinol-cytochrome C chaperone [Alphaproteobacteria bacterium]
MTFFSAWWKTRPEQKSAAAIYMALVAQARQTGFYLNYGVPDTVDGRFDLIVLHAMLVMRRLRRDDTATADLRQALFDYMFSDMDRSLREMGVGDLSIGKHIKKMAKAFYGRAADCERGLDGDDALLASALTTSVFRGGGASQDKIGAMCKYLRSADRSLAGVATEDVVAGRLAWPQP